MNTRRQLRAWVGTIDRAMHGVLNRFGHDAHRVSLGVLMIRSLPRWRSRPPSSP